MGQMWSPIYSLIKLSSHWQLVADSLFIFSEKHRKVRFPFVASLVWLCDIISEDWRNHLNNGFVTFPCGHGQRGSRSVVSNSIYVMVKVHLSLSGPDQLICCFITCKKEKKCPLFFCFKKKRVDLRILIHEVF